MISFLLFLFEIIIVAVVSIYLYKNVEFIRKYTDKLSERISDILKKAYEFLKKRKASDSGFKNDLQGPILLDPDTSYKADSEVSSSFAAYAKYFEGLYEPMYKASLGRISLERSINVFLEWNIRMKNIPNVPISLNGWWISIYKNASDATAAEIKEKAADMIKVIEDAGVIRDDRNTFVADEMTRMFYQCDEDTCFTAGQTLQIDKPCWYMNTESAQIIEKGYCTIIK